jgi:thiamine-monophosphate kinase
MNEFALIDRYFRRPVGDKAVRLGIGDDGAVVAPSPGRDLVFSVDMLVEGRHFLAGVDAVKLGHKTLAVSLSDMAAMGARPRWALLAGALPDVDEDWLRGFAHGLFALADRFGIALIGGDTTRGPRNLCLTIVGEVPAGTAMKRSGAMADDDIYVSGTLGDAALALAVLQGSARIAAADFARARARLETPEPRVALGERLRGVATAAIDVSDGLTGDLSHILDSSGGGGAAIDVARIPRSPCLDAMLGGAARDAGLACILGGGDDYELCFTAAAASREAIAAIARGVDVPLTRIGSITASPGLVVCDECGVPLPAIPRSFDHFG